MNIKRIFFYILLAANVTVTLLFWWQGSHTLLLSGQTSGILIAIGRLLGLLSMLGILVQLSLVSRVKILEQEYGFDNLNRLHRQLGKIIISVLVFHPIFLTTGYALLSHVSLITQFINFLTNWEDVLNAFIGFLALLTAVTVSLVIIRKKLHYDTWYFTHLLVYVAIALFFGHQVQTADVSQGVAFYYWYALNFTIFGLFLLYRFIRPLYFFTKHRFYIDHVKKESPTVTSLYLKGKNIKDFMFQSGQYANLTFLTTRDWYTHHPFSFSHAYDGHSIRFSIKNVGDFTARVQEFKPGTKVILDGPLGVFTEKKATHQKKFLLIAGGIGITPLRSLAESIITHGKDVILLYGIQTKEEMVFRSEFEKLDVKTYFVLSNEKDPNHAQGYINSDLISKWVRDIAEREIYLCGPEKMMQSVLIELQKLGVDSKRVRYERFAY
jgi:predicted ferric reductase